MSFQCATAPNVVFGSREELHEHYKSEWHRYNLRRRAAGLAPITKDVFDKVRALAASQDKQSEQKVRKQDHVKNKKRDDDREESSNKMDDDEDDEEEAPKESMEARVKKAIEEFKPDPCKCIFDGQAAETIESNLDHMHRQHGFIIPDLASVKNLPGLVNYIAEKVHVGRICLTCEREFKTSAACIWHMTSKGHCKIPFEYEDQVEEFVEYYDFTQGQPEADGNQGTIELDPSTGELVLRDAEGVATKRLGPSREFRSLYRMLREESRQSVDSGIANAVKERSLQIYQRAGVLTTSSALTIAAKQRLSKQASQLQTRQERRFHEQTIKDGMRINQLIKDRKAGTNVGAGHGVHG